MELIIQLSHFQTQVSIPLFQSHLSATESPLAYGEYSAVGVPLIRRGLPLFL